MMGVKSWRGTVAALMISALAVGGCTTQAQRIGADDGTDACRVYKVALDSTGDFFGEDMVKGAAIGAVGGALMGGLIGGNWQSALVGAAAGAAVGAAAGYYEHVQQQNRDQAVLQNTILSDLERENAQIDKAQLAFDQLVACRRNEAERVRTDLVAGRISRPAAEQRMATLRQQYSGDVQLAQMIRENIVKRSTNFEFANEQVNPNSKAQVASLAQEEQSTMTAPAAKVQKPRRPKPVAATQQGKILEQTASNQAKRSTFSQRVDTAAADQSGFQLSS